MTWKYNFIMTCIQTYRNIAILRFSFCDQQRSQKSQHFLEVDPDDPKVTKLLEEVRSLLANNKELAAKVEAATHVTIEKQVNVAQSGTGNTQTNTFNL